MQVFVFSTEKGAIRRAHGEGGDQPSKKLLDYAARLVEGTQECLLLGEQLTVFNQVMHTVEKAQRTGKKTILLIKGGPGTGKSLVAITLLGEISRSGYSAHYVTGSKPFADTLRNVLGSPASKQLKFLYSYANSPPSSIDVLICDEAHRLRASSNSRFTPQAKESHIPQICEVITAGTTVVFLIDDLQVVRPDEIGSSAYIKQEAKRLNCAVLEFELEAQFRCGSSDDFISWIDNTLGTRQTANALCNLDEKFEFRIFDNPKELERAIRTKIAEGNTGRVSAGCCWPWSDPTDYGHLVEDVQIGSYRRPWNPKLYERRLAKGIPKASLWAYDPAGIDQVGCVYTAQGFEFDYVGVIFGGDLVFDPETNDWIGNPAASYDTVLTRAKTDFVRHVKNTYRVLMTRGMKGCYVCFLNKPTEDFFRSRLEDGKH
jgi:hypothetical protein